MVDGDIGTFSGKFGGGGVGPPRDGPTWIRIRKNKATWF